jgi:hypothetical protein
MLLTANDYSGPISDPAGAMLTSVQVLHAQNKVDANKISVMRWNTLKEKFITETNINIKLSKFYVLVNRFLTSKDKLIWATKATYFDDGENYKNLKDYILQEVSKKELGPFSI